VRGELRADSWVGFHTFRHTCATILFRAGWNAVQVQRWLGHHKPSFTLDTYVHLLPEDLPEPVVFEDLSPGGDQPGDPNATKPAEVREAAQAQTAPFQPKRPLGRDRPNPRSTTLNPKAAGSIPARPIPPPMRKAASSNAFGSTLRYVAAR
jgi:hypothetical protein